MQIYSDDGRMLVINRIISNLRTAQMNTILRINKEKNSNAKALLQRDEAAIAEAITAIESLAGMVK